VLRAGEEVVIGNLRVGSNRLLINHFSPSIWYQIQCHFAVSASKSSTLMIHALLPAWLRLQQRLKATFAQFLFNKSRPRAMFSSSAIACTTGDSVLRATYAHSTSPNLDGFFLCNTISPFFRRVHSPYYPFTPAQ